MWAYARFLLYLEETDPAELNGPESYVKPESQTGSKRAVRAMPAFLHCQAADKGEQHRFLPNRTLHCNGAKDLAWSVADGIASCFSPAKNPPAARSSDAGEEHLEREVRVRGSGCFSLQH